MSYERPLMYPVYPPLDLDAWKHLDWTVTAGGYRLVIVGGAIIGLERAW